MADSDSPETKDLQESIDQLTRAVRELTNIFKTASDDIHAESGNVFDKKLDILIDQNQQVGKALLVLLESNKEKNVEKQEGRILPSHLKPMGKIEPKI